MFDHIFSFPPLTVGVPLLNLSGPPSLLRSSCLFCAGNIFGRHVCNRQRHSGRCWSRRDDHTALVETDGPCRKRLAFPFLAVRPSGGRAPNFLPKL